MNYNFTTIILDFIITITAYLITPFILFYETKKNIIKKKRKRY